MVLLNSVLLPAKLLSIGDLNIVENNILVDKQRWTQKFKGSTRPQPTTIYTGTALLGIAQIPKSNAVPVFNAQQAKDTVKVK